MGFGPPLIRPGADIRLVRTQFCLFDECNPGGQIDLAFCNGWNPGARYVTRRIPYDHDAQTLTPLEAQYRSLCRRPSLVEV
jgi:hypothetical protein